MNNIRHATRWLLAAGAIGFAQGAAALSASPMVLEMQSSGEQSRTTLTVENPSDQTLSIELETLALTMAADGETSFTPEDESLIVFPPVASLGPGRSQVFQIQFVGDPELDASKSFRLSILQLPVQLGDTASSSSLSVATNIHTLVNVAPNGATADLEVVSIESAGSGNEWILGIRNDGNRHARLQETVWQIQTPTTNRLLSRIDIASLVDGSLVLPKSTRTVRLTSPDGLDLSGAKITIAVPN